ncbi:hypothetical protein MJN51_32255, partial [Salmonella enterica subsp. enterica serovar Kentucky]|nr:hypothetical protein [Salmonella enterica subsp. enterica serovar Kentucky]
YTAAMDKGLTLASMLNDVPISRWDAGAGSDWRPKNSPPQYAGDILREWREKGKQEPVLILTARDALAERVEGLRLGADDYLCKP